MTSKLKKSLRQIPRADLIRINQVLKKMQSRSLELKKIKKLEGYEDIYRTRVGRYRIIYFDDGDRIIIKAIRKRDESTYGNI
ncbi:type II toxin-antitoxin system RelE/ParE family toxin [Patescibacteria group bacterium]|nr:type II toxin-antitoxin system RelE/ParE family toxin [Patescibacteria group bacterium]